MFSKLKKVSFLALAVILGLTVSAFAQDSAGEKGTFKKEPDSTKKESTTTKKNDGDISIGKPKDKSTTQNTSGILFPEVEGWDKSDKTTYPVLGLGYSYNYESADGGRVTIYVYDKRLSEIPDGVSNSAVKDEFKQVKNEISQFGKAGVYQNLKEAKSEIITLGGTSGKIKSLYALFYFTVKGQEMASELYIFGYKNNFIKIRATRPKSAVNSRELANLLAEIDTVFAD